MAGQILLPGFNADDTLELTHHVGVRVRACRRADHVVGVAHVGHPITHGLVQGIFQGFCAAFDLNHFGTQQFHPKHVESLAHRVGGTHVNLAIEAEEGTDRRGRYAMLTRPGFGDDALLPHALGEQTLPQCIVDLVGAGVTQIFPLDRHLIAGGFAQPSGLGQRGFATDIVAQKCLELIPKLRIPPGISERLIEFIECRHEGLGDITSAVRSKTTGNGLNCRHVSILRENSRHLPAERPWRYSLV